MKTLKACDMTPQSQPSLTHRVMLRATDNFHRHLSPGAKGSDSLGRLLSTNLSDLDRGEKKKTKLDFIASFFLSFACKLIRIEHLL